MSHSAWEEQLTHPGECVSPGGERTIYSINTPRLLKRSSAQYTIYCGCHIHLPSGIFFFFSISYSLGFSVSFLCASWFPSFMVKELTSYFTLSSAPVQQTDMWRFSVIQVMLVSVWSCTTELLFRNLSHFPFWSFMWTLTRRFSGGQNITFASHSWNIEEWIRWLHADSPAEITRRTSFVSVFILTVHTQVVLYSKNICGYSSATELKEGLLLWWELLLFRSLVFFFFFHSPR